MKTSREKKDSAIAAVITFLLMLALFLWLFFCGLTWDKGALASSSIPEEQSDEELFLDPELLQEISDGSESDLHETEAPLDKGEPEKAETENRQLNDPGENPKPDVKTEKIVTQEKKSPVKTTEPSASDKEREKVTSRMAGKFNPHNGAPDGKAVSSGTGGTGVGVSGKVSGRSFLGCDKPVVALKVKTVVKVSVTVDADGRVTSASASGAADAKIRRKCEAAARTARWSAKKGAAPARGTITFTITPV